MATVQVILNGMPGGTVHDTDNYPVILQFGEDKTYENATWVIPSYPGHIPAYMLSEIRVQGEPLECYIEGPEGFKSGPHETNWVRCAYPRGKFCSFLLTNPETHQMGGVSIEVVEDSLIVDPVQVGKKAE